MDTRPSSGSHQEPFIEKIYLVGAVLDPQYMMYWVDADVVFTHDTENAKTKLKDTLKGMLGLRSINQSLKKGSDMFKTFLVNLVSNIHV